MRYGRRDKARSHKEGRKQDVREREERRRIAGKMSMERAEMLVNPQF